MTIPFRSITGMAHVQNMSASIAFYITIGMFEAVWALLLTDLGARKILISITLSLFTVPMIFLAPTGGRYAQRFGPLRVAGFSVLVAALCTLSYGFLPLWPVLVLFRPTEADEDADAIWS